MVHMADGQLVQMPCVRDDALFGRISGKLLIEVLRLLVKAAWSALQRTFINPSSAV